MIEGVAESIEGLKELEMMGRSGHARLVFAGEVLQEGVGIGRAVEEACGRGFPHLSAEVDEGVVGAEEGAQAEDFLVFLCGLERLVEAKHLARHLVLPACGSQSGAVVAVGVERREVPHSPHADQGIDRPAAAIHVVEEVEPGIAVPPLGKGADAGAERGVEQLIAAVEECSAGIKEGQLGAVDFQARHRRRLRAFEPLHLALAAPDEGREQALQTVALGAEGEGGLLGLHALGLQSDDVAFDGSSGLHSRCELAHVVGKEGLQEGVVVELFVHEENTEEEVVHPLPQGIELHGRLLLLNVGIGLCHSLLGADVSAVIKALIEIEREFILVARHPLWDGLPGGTKHLCEGVGPLRDVALQSGLCRSRDLRQPALLEVGQRERLGLPNQVGLPHQRVVLLGEPVTLVEGELCTQWKACKHHHGQEEQKMVAERGEGGGRNHECEGWLMLQR